MRSQSWAREEERLPWVTKERGVIWQIVSIDQGNFTCSRSRAQTKVYHNTTKLTHSTTNLIAVVNLHQHQHPRPLRSHAHWTVRNALFRSSLIGLPHAKQWWEPIAKCRERPGARWPRGRPHCSRACGQNKASYAMARATSMGRHRS